MTVLCLPACLPACLPLMMGLLHTLLIDHGTNDGQNCVNVWPFLAGHGAVWERNKCIIPRSRNGACARHPAP